MDNNKFVINKKANNFLLDGEHITKTYRKCINHSPQLTLTTKKDQTTYYRNSLTLFIECQPQTCYKYTPSTL